MNSVGVHDMSKYCPLCSGQIFARWLFGLSICKRCDLVVADSIWQRAANEQLNEAFFGVNYEPFRSAWVRIFERLNNRRTMKRLRAATGVGVQLLEIGVGSGSFLEYAKTCGYSPLGCDLSPAICSRIEQRTGISMHCGYLESLSNQQLFDVVVMNHVLEHVSDPVALLKAVRSRLKRGGLLHLAVPNVGSWEARLPGWNSYEPYHLLYFTPQTLQLAAERAGFEIQRMTTHESFSGWFLAILCTLLTKDNVRQSQQKLRTSTKQSTSIVEHAYYFVMVTWGVFTFPFRLFQEFHGKADEIILLATNGTDS